MRLHAMKPENIRDCVEIVASHPVAGPRYGKDIALLPEAWLRLISCEAQKSAVIFDDESSRSPVLYFGITSFVRDEFVQEIKTAPLFWVAPELARRIVAGNAPVLSGRDLREANSRGCSWIPADTSLTFHTDEPSYSGNNEHTVLLGFPYGHLSEKRLRPSRHIDIQFKGDLDSRGYLYVLRRIEEATRKNGSENEITMCLTLPETPPSQEEFAVWVKQSVNQAARQLFQEVYWLLRHRRAHLFGGSGPTSRIRYYFSCCGCVAPRSIFGVTRSRFGIFSRSGSYLWCCSPRDWGSRQSHAASWKQRGKLKSANTRQRRPPKGNGKTSGTTSGGCA